jgi:hypothetical protein
MPHQGATADSCATAHLRTSQAGRRVVIRRFSCQWPLSAVPVYGPWPVSPVAYSYIVAPKVNVLFRRIQLQASHGGSVSVGLRVTGLQGHMIH